MAEANVYHQLVDIHAEKPTREVACMLDQQISAPDMLVASYTVDDGQNTTAEQNPYEMLLAKLHTQLVTLEETHTFSPDPLNVFTAGYTRPTLHHSLPISISPAGVLPFVTGYPIGQFKIGSGSVGSSGITVADSGPNTGSEQNEQASISPMKTMCNGLRAGTPFPLEAGRSMCAGRSKA
jgi:hypothetical protein